MILLIVAVVLFLIRMVNSTEMKGVDYMLLGVIFVLGFGILSEFENVDDLLNYKYSSSDTALKDKVKNVSNPEKEITMAPYGCFSNILDSFFLKKMNPFSKLKEFDSGIVISENRTEDDFKDLLQKISDNGFSSFARKFSTFKTVSIEDLCRIAAFAGYSYVTISKNGLNERGKVYLTYSPPMDTHNISGSYTEEEYNKALAKSDLPEYTLTPKLNEYTNEQELAPGKELACGYPCLPDGQPETFIDAQGVRRQYMCGSTTHPTIKTRPRYSVYKVVIH